MNNNYVNDSNTNDDNINEESVIYTLMTIIIGIILGSIVGYFIFKDIKYIGPDSNEIVKKIYTDTDGKKYKYVPKISICPLNYSMNKLHNPNFKDSH
jgi:hypothetical protein